jgi:hypothetical protein
MEGGKLSVPVPILPRNDLQLPTEYENDLAQGPMRAYL